MTHLGKSWCIAIAMSSVAAAACVTAASPAQDQLAQSTQTNGHIEQIPTTAAPYPTMADQLEKPDSRGTDAVTMAQLRQDLEPLAGEDGDAETALESQQSSPEIRLYQQVAQVWATIRARGQQPTPELIAQEIGPDNLARFLDQNPGSTSMFGQDSDNLPVDAPEGVTPPLMIPVP